MLKKCLREVVLPLSVQHITGHQVFQSAAVIKLIIILLGNSQSTFQKAAIIGQRTSVLVTDKLANH